jgi:hypothetical protein
MSIKIKKLSGPLQATIQMIIIDATAELEHTVETL